MNTAAMSTVICVLSSHGKLLRCGSLQALGSGSTPASRRSSSSKRRAKVTGASNQLCGSVFSFPPRTHVVKARRDVKAAEQATVVYVAGVLRIEAPVAKNQYFGPSGSIEVTIQLPAGSSIEAKASCTEFRGVGRLGDVACEGAHGAVKIDEAASVRPTVIVEPGGGLAASLVVSRTTDSLLR
jgi:hypothetical protein